jgi:hypothetical protein
VAEASEPGSCLISTRRTNRSEGNTNELPQSLAPLSDLHSILVAASLVSSTAHTKFSQGHCQEQEPGSLGNVVQA